MHVVAISINPCIINLAICRCHLYKYLIALTHAYGQCLGAVLKIKHEIPWYLRVTLLLISNLELFTTVRRDLLWSTMATGMASADIGSRASLWAPTQPVAAKPSHNLFYVNFLQTHHFVFFSLYSLRTEKWNNQMYMCVAYPTSEYAPVSCGFYSLDAHQPVRLAGGW
jgi:hypothetical protein